MIKTVSLETAKKLKDRGLEIDIHFIYFYTGEEYVHIEYDVFKGYYADKVVKSPTLCELLEVAPNNIFKQGSLYVLRISKAFKYSVHVNYSEVNNVNNILLDVSVDSNNPAEALALLLIKLHDKNIINIKELNEK